jgi:hypothetical protein
MEWGSGNQRGGLRHVHRNTWSMNKWPGKPDGLGCYPSIQFLLPKKALYIKPVDFPPAQDCKGSRVKYRGTHIYLACGL